MKFKNQSNLLQVLRLPSIHFVKKESGIFWDDTPPRKTLEPGEIVETSNELDIKYLRELSAPRQERNRRGEIEIKPGFFVELEG